MLRRVWCAIVLAGMCLGSSAAWSADVEIGLHVEKGKLVSGPKVIKLTRGDRVSITVVSDAPDAMHVHGYELHLEVPAEQPATVRFEADKTGRFTTELHQSGAQLVILEIYPK